MRKSKRGPALFDILHDDGGTASETLRVPGWWGRSGTPRERIRAARRTPQAGREPLAPETGDPAAGLRAMLPEKVILAVK